MRSPKRCSLLAQRSARPPWPCRRTCPVLRASRSFCAPALPGREARVSGSNSRRVRKWERGASEQVTLTVFDIALLERQPLGFGLDALGHDLRAHFPAQPRDAANELGEPVIRGDALDQVPVE